MKPTQGQVVNVVVAYGGILDGVVVLPFDGDRQAIAAKLGLSEAEVEVLHGMRATIEVRGDPQFYTVTNMEYDAKGTREGTWHFKSEETE